MLPPEVVCAVCKRGSSGHSPVVTDRDGNVVYGGQCTALRRTSKRHGQTENLR